MSLRVMVSVDPDDARIAQVLDSLNACYSEIDIYALTHDAHSKISCATQGQLKGNTRLTSKSQLRFAIDLAMFRPHITICEYFGWPSLFATLLRLMSRGSRLVLCTTEPPDKPGRLQRWILRNTDGVCAEGHAGAITAEQLKFLLSRNVPTLQPYNLEPFLACQRVRSKDEVRRLVFAGDLSPGSGAADLLINVIAWIERNPEQQVDIWWAGDGELAKVLDAQPLPPGITQSFIGQLEPSEMASTFTRCGLLVAPSFSWDRRAPVLEGLAAGLPVLGSRLNERIQQTVQDDVNGWLFNPLQPDGLANALNRAMTVPLGTLEEMRDHARAAARLNLTCSPTEQFPPTLAADMPEIVQDALSQPAS